MTSTDKMREAIVQTIMHVFGTRAVSVMWEKTADAIIAGPIAELVRERDELRKGSYALSAERRVLAAERERDEAQAVAKAEQGDVAILQNQLVAAERDLDEAVKLLARAMFRYETITAQAMSHALLNRIKEARENG
jgi:hypothetical protein